jgi:hypothetical protein
VRSIKVGGQSPGGGISLAVGGTDRDVPKIKAAQLMATIGETSQSPLAEPTVIDAPAQITQIPV